LSEALLSKSGATRDRWAGKRDREGRYAAQSQSVDRKRDANYFVNINDTKLTSDFSSSLSLGGKSLCWDCNGN